MVALNLRAPFVTVAPAASFLREGLDVGSGQVGVLTSLPVLCFGLLAPVGLAASRRCGPDAAVLLCLAGVVAGSLVRSLGSYPAAVVGTVVIGAGITIGNIVVPVLIRRDCPPATVGAVTGAYVSTMNVGSVAVSLGAAPLAAAAGWQVALLAPAVLAVLAGVLWVLRTRLTARAEATSADPATAGGARSAAEATWAVPVWRRPLAWLLVLAFCAQSSSYYGTTAWLPSILQDDLGLTASAAGAASSVFQLSGIAGALGLPLLALRLPAPVTVAAVGVLWVSLPTQLLLAPDAWVAGSVAGGVAQGGGLAALFTVIVQVADTQREGEALSTLVQGLGYCVAACVPTLLGVLRDAADSWAPALLVLLGTTAAFLVLGTTAALAVRRRELARA